MSGKSFEKLVNLISRLRSKNGCPWDRRQTHSSIKKHLVEEAYEVCDAIDSKNPKALKDELGDLLFQVIFHTQIAKEHRAFDIYDVIRTSYKKMLRRHPHVFGKYKAKSPDEAYRRWQEKKDEENNYEGEKTILKGIPNTLPALLKAQKLSKRAAWAGFNWPDIKGVVGKIDEELEEVKEALKEKNKRHLSEEIGDLLFVIAILARHKGIDAEEALHRTAKKFAKRFRKIEEGLEKRGKKIKECDLKELTRLWNLHK